MPFPSSISITLKASRAYATESHLGTALSRKSTLLLTTPEVLHCSRFWINTYYQILNTGLDRSPETGKRGVPSRNAELVEHGDPRGGGRSQIRRHNTYLAWSELRWRCLEYSSPPLVPHQEMICIVHPSPLTLYPIDARIQAINGKMMHRGHHSLTTPTLSCSIL